VSRGLRAFITNGMNLALEKHWLIYEPNSNQIRIKFIYCFWTFLRDVSSGFSIKRWLHPFAGIAGRAWFFA
jgi:hypothetical protein